MTLNIEQLRAAFKQADQSSNSRPNNYYPFWEIPDGSQASVRFLPDKNVENPMGFMVEKLTHTLTINGENKSVPCLKMYGEECPICKVSSAYYKDDDKVNGKKYWRKKQHIAQVLVTEDPLPPDENTDETHNGKVRFVQLGYQLFNIIKDAFESGELDEVPFAFDGGTDFLIKRTKQGDYPNYSLSKFARRSTDLSADQVAFVEDQMIDLHTLLPQHPGLEKVERMLEAALTGAEYSENESTTTTSSAPEEKPAPKTRRNTKSKAEAKVEETVETEETETSAEFDDEADEILAQIRARQSQKS